MQAHRLLMIGVACYIFGLQSSAQTPSPTPTAANPPPAIRRIVTDDTREELILATAGGAVAVFVIWRVRRGVLSYHVNQFRVSFVVEDCSITPAALSKMLEEKFGEIFKGNPHAEADDHPLGGRHMIQFKAKGMLADIHKRVRGQRVDDVIKLRAGDEAKAETRPDDSVFHVLTLRFDSVRTEEVKDNPGVPPSELLKTSPRKSGLKWPLSFRFFDQHFLAGVRSWRIAPAAGCDKYGEPVPDDDGAFFLETAAFERYSHILYKIITRKAIEETWQDFLCNAIVKFREEIKTLRPVKCGRPDDRPEFELNGRRWQERRGRKWDAGGAAIQIWQRDASFSNKEVKTLGDENGYGPRLFSLHPGVGEEYHDALGH